MKRTFIIIVILLIGVPVFAQQSQDMSFYIREYNRSDSTINDMLDVLKMVKDENLTGTGDFYQNAIRVYIQRLSNYSHHRYRTQVEEAATLILQGLAAEKHTAAASYIWNLLQYFDISQMQNDGYLMIEAINAMGQVDAKNYAKHLADLLGKYNARATTDPVAKIRVQHVVPALIRALEALCEPVGVKPVFLASIGWYDDDVKAVASAAINNMIEALNEVISDTISNVILDHFNFPNTKILAWQEMLRSQLPDASKAKVAVAAYEASYTFATTSLESLNTLRLLRLSAIDTIRTMGVEDERAYDFLERTYREAHDLTPNTDFEVSILVISTLAAVKTEESIKLLAEFLRGLDSRKRSGPWIAVDRDIMSILIQSLGTTGTDSREVIQLLTRISGSTAYTIAEQAWAKEALTALGR